MPSYPMNYNKSKFGINTLQFSNIGLYALHSVVWVQLISSGVNALWLQSLKLNIVSKRSANFVTDFDDSFYSSKRKHSKEVYSLRSILQTGHCKCQMN